MSPAPLYPHLPPRSVHRPAPWKEPPSVCSEAEGSAHFCEVLGVCKREPHMHHNTSRQMSGSSFSASLGALLSAPRSLGARVSGKEELSRVSCTPPPPRCLVPSQWPAVVFGFPP